MTAITELRSADRRRRTRMEVERIGVRPDLLLCVIDLTEKFPRLVLVRVADNSNFTAGMMIEAIQSDDRVWEFHNRRGGDESTVGILPQQRGAW